MAGVSKQQHETHFEMPIFYLGVRDLARSRAPRHPPIRKSLEFKRFV
jgi:hypothetical protein